MPRPEAIELTSDEQSWRDQVSFEAPYTHDQEPAAKLAKSLFSRGAIPAVRLAWLDDPDFNMNSKSLSIRQQVFEDNGLTGDRLLTDGSFLPYLRYFMDGPDLPSGVIDTFCAEVDRHRLSSGSLHITGSVRDELVATAKDGMRRYGLYGFEAAEEFWKLAIECGIEKVDARMIRDAVRKTRTSGRH